MLLIAWLLVAYNFLHWSNPITQKKTEKRKTREHAEQRTRPLNPRNKPRPSSVFRFQGWEISLCEWFQLHATPTNHNTQMQAAERRKRKAQPRRPPRSNDTTTCALQLDRDQITRPASQRKGLCTGTPCLRMSSQNHTIITSYDYYVVIIVITCGNYPNF